MYAYVFKVVFHTVFSNKIVYVSFISKLSVHNSNRYVSASYGLDQMVNWNHEFESIPRRVFMSAFVFRSLILGI